MDIFSSFKCVACLLKALKVLHWIKKAMCVGIVCIMIAVTFAGISQNSDEVKRLVKQIKKKVM